MNLIATRGGLARRWALVERVRPGTAGWFAAVVLLVGGCKYARPADVPDGGGEPVDAATDHAVGGAVAGLWQNSGVVLRMQADSVDEFLNRNANGAFSFARRLPAATSYAVSASGQPVQQACTVIGGNGTVGGEDVDEISVRCTPSFAVDIELSAPVSWTFDPTVTSYTLDASIATQSTRVAVTCATATTIRVNGSAVPSGVATSPIALAVGESTLSIDIGAGDISQRYSITMHRGGVPVGQAMYGKASNSDPGDRFGAVVAVDGDRIAVAAPGEDSGRSDNPADNSLPDSGAVYVFRRTGTQWSEEAYLKYPGTPAQTGFARSIALSGDTLAVAYPGSVFVYRRGANGWAWAQEVRGSTAEAFGWQVRLLGDVMVVAAPAEPSNSQGVTNEQNLMGPGFGALDVFRWNGVAWLREAFLKPTGILNPDEPELGQRGLALAPDLIAAAFNEDAGPRIQVYRRTGGAWMVDGVLVPASGYDRQDAFGDAVAATSDTIVVGASAEDSNATGFGGNRLDNSAANSGAVYVFRRGVAGWVDDAYIKAPNTGAGDLFGARLALSGELLAVAAPGEDSSTSGVDGSPDEATQDGGAVYLFRRVGDLWMPPRYVKASNPGASDQFGSALALSADTLVSGTEFEDSNARGIDGNQASEAAISSGAVYVFR